MQTPDLDYERFEQRFKDKVRIGAGGFGTVYKVFDHAKNHYVALKVSAVKPEFQKFTLKNEVELVNRMEKHRNIARYDACYRYNTGIAGEMDFAILKFYEDGNLEQFLEKTKLGLNETRLIVEDILRGVQFLHRNEVIHRDLKAQNILMSREDGVWCPKITDFGLSREVGGSETITNSAVGISYAYAAPEQILNQKIYKNVDLWAIGVMIYRIVIGELPFKGTDATTGRDAQSQFELSRKIVNVELPAAYDSMPEPYKAMVGACLVKDPKERAQNVEVLLDILHGRVRVSEDKDNKPPDVIDDSTQIIQKPLPKVGENYNIPDYNAEPFEQTTYQQPKQNVTQFYTPKPTEPEPTAESEPEQEPIQAIDGGERGKFNYRHLLIIGSVILAVILGVGAFYGIDDFKKEPLPSYTGSLTPEQEVTEEFTDLDLSPEQAANPDLLSKTLENVGREIETGLYDDNYRLHFIKAKLFAYQNEPRESFEELEKARDIALRTGKGTDLKEDMLADEKVFEKFTKKLAAARTKWTRIVNSM